MKVGKFGSKVEARRFQFLETLQKTGVISDLVAHPIYIITPDYWPVIKMIPDAQYVDIRGDITGIPGKLVIEDTKGMITDVFKIKVKMFHGKFPSIGIFVAKERKGRWVLEDYIPAKTRKKKIIEQFI